MSLVNKFTLFALINSKMLRKCSCKTPAMSHSMQTSPFPTFLFHCLINPPAHVFGHPVTTHTHSIQAFHSTNWLRNPRHRIPSSYLPVARQPWQAGRSAFCLFSCLPARLISPQGSPSHPETRDPVMWTISLRRQSWKNGEEETDRRKRQGQFALSKHCCLLLSFEASYQSQP